VEVWHKDLDYTRLDCMKGFSPEVMGRQDFWEAAHLWEDLSLHFVEVQAQRTGQLVEDHSAQTSVRELSVWVDLLVNPISVGPGSNHPPA